MWIKFLPWKFIVRTAAARQGFIDPIKLLAQLQNFAQPSEVAAPTELLRSGAVIHARGLINSLAIQHNLDWIWPYWIECQYNPRNEAFIPRSFSVTQINLTNRNWTAVGVPDSSEFSIVDPRGLVTPCYDGWSIDAWIMPVDGKPLIPSRLPSVSQEITKDKNLSITTVSRLDQIRLQTTVQMIGSPEAPICEVKVTGLAPSVAWLVISLRPYNPEGVSFVNTVDLLKDRLGWQVNKKDFVYFSQPPYQCEFSYYHHGDVYRRLPSQEDKQKVVCHVGMATAAALYRLEPGVSQEITVTVPLTAEIKEKKSSQESLHIAELAWERGLQGACSLQIPDEQFQFLYETAIRTMVLHSPKEVYPGPYIYRRFWFRDAAFILYGLLCVGLKDRVLRALNCFPSRQTHGGYFLSQEGEWDSNGEALWIMRQYCEMTGSPLPKAWREPIRKAANWICKKRLSENLKLNHAGLMPSGFSAEHLGPNDFYYWDDFWSVAGLRAASYFMTRDNNISEAARMDLEAQGLLECIDKSLRKTVEHLKCLAIPASPYRRLDSGAIGSLTASYPIRLYAPEDPRILDTVDFLMKKCLVKGGFFHDMTHSGINPYLTLDLAQVLLRAGDARYFDLMHAVADLATPTGQWPEAIHPRTGGGCMGDGQHVWAAAEWVVMLRNCFVREEDNTLILCSGIPRTWLDKKTQMFFGVAPTIFGDIQITIKHEQDEIVVEWLGTWFAQEPQIIVSVPGFLKVIVVPQCCRVVLKPEKKV